MTVFPLTCPTSLRVTPGRHPVRVSRSISGATRARLFGSLPTDAALQASFLCSSEAAGEVFSHFHQSRSGALPITLMDSFFQGHEDVARALPDHLQWFYNPEREPEVEAVRAGLVRLSVEFNGRMEV